MTEKQSGASGGEIQSVACAAEILRLMLQGSGVVTLRRAAEDLRIQRTTMHRYLGTMEAVGFIRRVRDGTKAGHYELGTLVHQLASMVASESRVVVVASARLQQIADATRVTAVLSLPSRGAAVVTDSAFPRDVPITVRISAGYAIPLDGAQSMLLHAYEQQEVAARLAEGLPRERRSEFVAAVTRARADGYISRLVGDDLRVIAAPIFDGGTVVATLGVIGLATSLDAEAGERTRELVMREASSISGVVSGAGLP